VWLLFHVLPSLKELCLPYCYIFCRLFDNNLMTGEIFANVDMVTTFEVL
jgi:hypothetical protein